MSAEKHGNQFGQDRPILAVEGKTVRTYGEQQILEYTNSSSQSWKKFEATIDSGACEHVYPKTAAPGCPIMETAASKAGIHFSGADGGRMRNLGCQTWEAYNDVGIQTNIKVQVADGIHRTLFSVARLVECGNKVVFDKAGSYIENVTTGHVTPIIYSGFTYKLVP